MGGVQRVRGIVGRAEGVGRDWGVVVAGAGEDAGGDFAAVGYEEAVNWGM